MKYRLLTLIGGSLALWLLIAAPLCLVLGSQQWLCSSAALVLCLVPAAATLWWCEMALAGSPEQQLAAVLGGTGLRLVFVVGIGLVLFYLVPGFDSVSLWLWIVGFYLVTLTLETILLARRQVPVGEKPRKLDG